MNTPTAHILIVEDEPIIAGFIRKTLLALGYGVAGHARSHREAVELLATVQVDLALVDIALGGKKDGIDVAHHMRSLGDTPFIFLTSYADPQTIDRAKPTRPAGYVVKPFNASDLYSSIELALSASQQGVEPAAALFLPDGFGKVRVEFADVLFIESRRMYLDVHTTGRVYTQRIALSKFTESLPAQQFMRLHRSIVVNLQHITRWNRTSVWIGDRELPVGRTYQTEVFQALQGRE